MRHSKTLSFTLIIACAALFANCSAQMPELKSASLSPTQSVQAELAEESGSAPDGDADGATEFATRYRPDLVIGAPRDAIAHMHALIPAQSDNLLDSVGSPNATTEEVQQVDPQTVVGSDSSSPISINANMNDNSDAIELGTVTGSDAASDEAIEINANEVPSDVIEPGMIPETDAPADEMIGMSDNEVPSNVIEAGTIPETDAPADQTIGMSDNEVPSNVIEGSNAETDNIIDANIDDLVDHPGDVVSPICGDGIVFGPAEQCDEGDTDLWDILGVDSCNTASEACGHPDSSKPCQCYQPSCGDGIITPGDPGQGGETCDPAAVPDEGCDEGLFCNAATCQCQLFNDFLDASCGDGSINQSWEECDGPNYPCPAPIGAAPLACDGCKCIEPVCGDGKLEGTEECGETTPFGTITCPSGLVCNTNTCTCFEFTEVPSCDCSTFDCPPEKHCAKLANTCFCVSDAEVPTCKPDGIKDFFEECDPQIQKPNLGSCGPNENCTAQCTCEPKLCNPTDGYFDDENETCDPSVAPGSEGSCPANQVCNNQCECQPGPTGCVGDGVLNSPDEECDLALSNLTPGTQPYLDALKHQCEDVSGLTLAPNAAWLVCEMSMCKCIAKLPKCEMGQPNVECDQQPPPLSQCAEPFSSCSVDCKCLPPPPSTECNHDNQKDPNELCDGDDPGVCSTIPGPAQFVCDDNCQCTKKEEPYCGDGIQDIATEECEPGVVYCLGQTTCDPSDCKCKFPPTSTCGDGYLDFMNEQCDWSAAQPGCPPDKMCNKSCHCVKSVQVENCGNGTLESNEECDPKAADPLASCTAAEDPISCEADCTCRYEKQPGSEPDPELPDVLVTTQNDCSVYAMTFSSEAAKEYVTELNEQARAASGRTDDLFSEQLQKIKVICRFGAASAPNMSLTSAQALELSGNPLPGAKDNLRPYALIQTGGSQLVSLGDYMTYRPLTNPNLILPVENTQAAQIAKAVVIPQLAESMGLSGLTPLLDANVDQSSGVTMINGVFEHRVISVLPGQSYSIPITKDEHEIVKAQSAQIPSGTGVAIHIMDILLQPSGTPYTAVEGYEEHPKIENRIMNPITVLDELASRKSADQPISGKALLKLSWDDPLNYQMVMGQEIYTLKGQATDEKPKMEYFVSLATMGGELGMGSGGCGCVLGSEQPHLRTLAASLAGSILVLALLLVSRRACRERARRARRPDEE